MDHAIADLETTQADHEAHNEFYEKLVEATENATEASETWAEIEHEEEPWTTLVGRVELVFIVFGTIQWGYGNHWVINLHKYLNG